MPPERLMELLSVINAKSIWNIDTKHLNPRGKNIEKELIEWLTTHYHFDRVPTLPLTEPEKGLEFGGGTFEIGTTDGNKEKFYADLTLFNDGLVASTRASTDITDKFLEEALAWADAEFRLHFRPELVQRKLYVSEVEVRLLRLRWILHPSFQSFADKIKALYPSNPKMDFDVGSVSFWADLSVQHWRPSPFIIERKLISSFEDIYYSRAPLRTEEHLKLLEELDQTLIATQRS